MGSNPPTLSRFPNAGKPQQPLAEFVATDDFESTREMVSVIRGHGGTSRMYGPSDPLPEVYANEFETAIYSDRVHAPGVWRKRVVVVREDDIDTILKHALIEGRRREIARRRRQAR
jgi:hypothetical protein